MQLIVKAALILAGVIHLIPLSGVLGPAQLSRLYGVVIDDPNVIVMLRHRAVLFGLVGSGFIAAAFVPAMIWPGIIAGLVATLSFIALAWTAPSINAELTRVVIADWIVVAALVAAAGIMLLDRAAR
jgi:hypothetical protein